MYMFDIGCSSKGYMCIFVLNNFYSDFYFFKKYELDIFFIFLFGLYIVVEEKGIKYKFNCVYGIYNLVK